MGEGLHNVSEFTPRPPELAPVPIEEDQQRQFAKEVELWSGALDIADASQSADISIAAMTSYMGDYATHRPVNELVQQRTGSRAGMKYERPGTTVLCKTADDLVSLVVESRKPKDGSETVDTVTRTEYVIDGLDSMTISDLDDEGVDDPLGGMLASLEEDEGLDGGFAEGPICEVVAVTWYVDRTTDKVVGREAVVDVEGTVTFDKKLDVKQLDDVTDEARSAVIAIPKEAKGKRDFTHARFWETEDIFAALREGGWQVSPIEQTINPREQQAGES